MIILRAIYIIYTSTYLSIYLSIYFSIYLPQDPDKAVGQGGAQNERPSSRL